MATQPSEDSGRLLVIMLALGHDRRDGLGLWTGASSAGSHGALVQPTLPRAWPPLDLRHGVVEVHKYLLWTVVQRS